MSRFLAVLFLASVTLIAGVNVTRDGNVVHIEIDGRPFSDFYFGPEAPKPYLHPLRSASGRIVTRRFPMEKVEGETTSDVHHRGLWLGYSSVNGFDFWQNEVSENNKLAGKVVTTSRMTVSADGKTLSMVDRDRGGRVNTYTFIKQ